MSWTVNVETNTLHVANVPYAKKIAKKLRPDYRLEINDDGTIEFDSDAMEWIDPFATNANLGSDLIHAGLTGMVTFVDLEGGTPKFWGYEFHAEGVTELEGVIHWTNKNMARAI